MSTVSCKHCQKEFCVPPCRVWRSNYCSSKCREDAKQNKLLERKRNCNFCNAEFFPRKQQIKDGNAKFCSAICRNKFSVQKFHTEEAREKKLKTYMEGVASGRIKHLSGPDHPRWMGGHKEMIKRRTANGKANESLKKYRAKNPDKTREWSSSRLSKKTGRLPKGTVKSKGENQKWKCVYCECDISTKYHVDHIFPLAKGGKHVPENIQLTCPSCNVRKHTKIDFVYSET